MFFTEAKTTTIPLEEFPMAKWGAWDEDTLLEAAAPEHYRAIWEANEEAFEDEWGHRRATDAGVHRCDRVV